MHWAITEYNNYGKLKRRRAVCCMTRDDLSECFDRYMFKGNKEEHIVDAEKYHHYPIYVDVPTVDKWGRGRFVAQCRNLYNDEKEIESIPMPPLYKELV